MLRDLHSFTVNKARTFGVKLSGFPIGPLARTSLHLLRNKEGNIAIMTALVSVVLLGAAGGAMDFAHALSVRSSLQSNLDAAVLAAAREPKNMQIVTAKQFFDAGLVSMTGYAARAEFTSDKDGVISGRAEASLKTSLLSILDIKEIPVSVRAAAATTSNEPSGNNAACILLLEESVNGFYVNSGAGIRKTDCEIHVRSAAYPAATFTDGGNGLDVARICVKGAQVSYNNQLNPAVEKNCSVAADGLSESLPEVRALGCNSQLGGHLPDNLNTHRLSPGIYCGWTSANGSPRIELKPGLYVIKDGGWSFNSGTTLVGEDVTLYFADTSKIFFNGNVNIDLSAPKTGPYKDILFFEAPNLAQSDLLFNGTNDAKLNGIIHMPSRNVHFNSTFAMNNDRTAIVFNRMSMDGTNWNIIPLTRVPSSGEAGRGGGGRLVY
ncbi:MULTISPECIES: TadE/TadG family type IV pilus assembly protein [unclassified Rhizobium]|uniref:TadE/TadG family type IV pilus assembly protein n=1 Tax=unclassified Rhizobium TaxID=2613769 RepID=UPI0024799B7C|nr:MULTISPECIES: TadE/TadG family type IV pilus assembly protein [unclassified Rhizobium]MDH7804537.1 hypothetical protein [Rhizobium sp. AN70]